MLLALAVLTTLTTNPVHAMESLPLETALAADQKEINGVTIQYESDQFEAIFQWQSTFDQWQMAQSRSKLKEQEFLRAKQLNESQIITAESFVIAKFHYDCSLNEIKRLEAEMEYAHARVEAARQNVLYWGNPDSGDIKALVESRLTERETKLKALQAGMISLSIEQKLTRLKLQMGNKLKEKGTVPQSDMDLRQFNVENVDQRIAALKNQIELTKKAIESGRKSLATLTKKQAP